MTHRIVSAHFDDAIGSCGGLIGRLRREGEDVVVHTIFAGIVDPPYSTLARKLHTSWNCSVHPYIARFEEDFAACASIGCRQVTSDFAEAIYRRNPSGYWLYADGRSLIGPVVPEDTELIERVANTLMNDSEKGMERLYFPLGVGNHVDHVVLFEAGALCLRDGISVVFYRDFYYLGDAPPRARELKLRRFLSRFDRCNFELKIRSFLQYRSQVPVLFGSEEAAAQYFVSTNGRYGSRREFAEELWVREG